MRQQLNIAALCSHFIPNFPTILGVKKHSANEAKRKLIRKICNHDDIEPLRRYK